MRRITVLLFFLALCGVAFSQTAPVDNGDGTFTVTVPMDSVVDAPVSIVAKGDTFEAVGARLKATFASDASVRYTKPDKADQWIVLTPATVLYDIPLDKIATTVGAPTVRAVISSLTTNTLEVPNVFPNARATYVATDSAVKEQLIIDAPFIAAIPKTAKVVQFVWRIEKGPGLTHISHALQGVCVGTFNTPMVLRIEPLEARDSVGSYLAGRSEYQSGFIIGSLDAVWLRSAKAPVLVDPIVQAGVPTADLCGLYVLTEPPSTTPCKVYFKFTLPSISGGTVTLAKLRNIADYYVSAVTCQSFVSQDVAWTEASNPATINAITLGTGLGSETIAASYTWYYWDVTGDAAKGIIKAYADARTEVTIVLRGSDSTVANVQSALDLTDAAIGAREVGLRDRLNEISQPGLLITYIGGSPLQGRPGFAIGGNLPF